MQELLTTVPSEFVAARNAAVKALRAAGARDEAAALGALRRIHAAEWALNVVALADPDVVADFAAAAETVLEAQETAMAGKPASDLREGLRAAREQTTRLAAAAHAELQRRGLGGAGTGEADVATRLTRMATNRAALGLLVRGLLGAEDPGIVDPFATGAPSTSPARSTEPASGRSAARATAKASQQSPAFATSEPPVAIDLAAERARRRAAGDAERNLVTARTDLVAAERALAKAEATVAKTSRRVADAEATLAAAKESLDAAAVDRDEAARRFAEASQVASDAERAVESLRRDR